MKHVVVLIMALVFMMPATAGADEILLKDGSKMVGTIMMLDSQRMKIQTAYGLLDVPRSDIQSAVIDAAPTGTGVAPKALSAPVAAARNPVAGGPTAAVNWGNGKAYFFRGGEYVRYTIGSGGADSGYPKAIDNRTWPGIPWTDGIDAVVNWGNGKVYLFRGGEYVRYDIKADRVDPGYPKAIDDRTWPGVPWRDGIDAAVNWGNGKVYLFRGGEYVRYTIGSDGADPGYPKPVNNSTWPGIPWTNGIDAAVNWGKGKVYLFRGGEYVRYDVKSDRVDPGYPKPVDKDTWPGLSWIDGS